jgi:hypothetical protein
MGGLVFLTSRRGGQSSLIAFHEVFRPGLGILVAPHELWFFFLSVHSRIGHLENSATTSSRGRERRRKSPERGERSAAEEVCLILAAS